MKQFLFTILSICVLSISNAQTPQGINYQGVARNASGVELPNQSIGLELSILDGSPTGTAVYTESHTLTTDANGLFSLVIGNGTPSTGTFATINWATGGSKWLKTSMDITGGTSYQLVGTTQLMSVPYALYAENVKKNGGKYKLILTDDVTDSEAATIIANEVGPNTQEVWIANTTNLTNLDLSVMTAAVKISITNNTALTSINLGNLQRCDGDLEIGANPNLSTLDLTALIKCTTGNMNITDNGISSLSFPNLVKVNYFGVGNNINLITVSLPVLTTANSTFTFASNPVLTSINIPVLDKIGQFHNITGCPMLTTMSYPALLSIGADINITHSGLTSISFPLLQEFTGVNVATTHNNLTVSTINSLLNTFVSITPALSGRDFDFALQAPFASPSGQGITDKNTLISNGNTVTTD